ncbi:hypothetical protein [Actinomycetospora succinea]|uniref:hypothetical protein n=1 Tax=Actinomycetospora succinea TaxID=663603 RepID=UPI00105FFB55|nr:hypothetical protein [Actinomycetospora succinea]
MINVQKADRDRRGGRKNSTLVMPFPVDLLRFFEHAGAASRGTAVPHEPALRSAPVSGDATPEHDPARPAATSRSNGAGRPDGGGTLPPAGG